MAREVAVDVASHSPQVDPILDDLVEALADLEPSDPQIPYYSATLYDPRDFADFDADYWADNLRHTVRFAAAVQAALEDGHRVFGELSPHPLLTYAVEQTARGLDVPLSALAAMRREQEMPDGMRSFVADLHSAGAAVDFSMLYPDGRLVDAPLPAWTRRHLLLTREVGEQAHGAAMAVHPLLGAHVRLPEEPERHVWQGDVGTAAQPWLGDHRVHNVEALPGAAYCEMALTAARVVIGADAEVRDVAFERMLLLEEDTPLSAVATVADPGRMTFEVETHQDGELTRRALATLGAADDAAPAGYDIADLLAAHPDRIDGAEMRDWFGARGVQYGPAFAGLVSANVAPGAASVLAQVALPGSIRSQQGAYAVHPALLDACFQSVGAHPDLHGDRSGTLMLPLGVRRLRAYGSTRNAHYCLARLTSVAATAVEADLDLLDEHGAVLMTVTGLRLGTGVSESGQRERVLNERMLTVDWRQQAAPELGTDEPGAWLLISTSRGADPLTAELAESLRAQQADVTTMSWLQNADHARHAESLAGQLAASAHRGVVVVTPPRNGAPEDQSGYRGGETVRHLTRIMRVLPDVLGELPRLFVLTRAAQTVLSGDVANLHQAGLRGFMRVIGHGVPAAEGDPDRRGRRDRPWPGWRPSCCRVRRRTKPLGGRTSGTPRG